MKQRLSLILSVSLVFIFALTFISCTCGKKKIPGVDEEVLSNLQIEDLQKGTGAEAVPGKKVTVHYVGWLSNGTKFDSSIDRKQPFTFVLGKEQVIKGWDHGLVGMKVGGKRKLTIPPELGYGKDGAGDVIPPFSTLTFEVELLKVE